MKRILLLLFVAAVLGVPGWLVYQRIAESRADALRADALPTNTAELRTLESAIETTGIVQPVVATEVRSEFSGKIDSIPVKNGQMVKQGDIVMELDKITVNAELEAAQREFDAQMLRLERAQLNYKRQSDLNDGGFAIESEFVNAGIDVKLAEIDLALRKTRLDTALDRLSKATLLAPQDGVVSDLTVNPGQVIVGATSVNQGTLLMKISTLNQMMVEADVNEIDMPKVKLGQEATVTFDSFPSVALAGKIVELAPSALLRNNLRVFPVKVSFERGEHDVRPGISANIRIPTARVENVVSIVVSAVFNVRGRSFVFVKNSAPGATDTYERRDVTTGLSDASHVEIVSGLAAEEEVSLTRPSAITNGELEPAMPRRGQAQGGFGPGGGGGGRGPGGGGRGPGGGGGGGGR